MRVRPLGKLLLFALVLGALYAGYRFAPDRYRSLDWHVSLPDLPHVNIKLPEPKDIAGAAAPGVAVAGLPPPVLLALSGASEDAVPTLPTRNPLTALDDVRNGKATAAVVDFPSVIYAAQSDRAPFRVVLLVGWRTGSDVIVSARSGGWRQGDRLAFLKGTSGEYLARRALGGPLPPALRKSLEAGLTPLASLDNAAGVADALAGRRDLLPRAASGWSAREGTSSQRIDERIPDVLVVSEAWAQDKPEEVDALLKRWLAAQSRLQWGGVTARRYYESYGKAAGLDELEVQEQMAPATVAEQAEFLGIGVPHGTWTKLAARQAMLTARTTATAAEPAPVPVDPRPMQRAMVVTETPPAS